MQQWRIYLKKRRASKAISHRWANTYRPEQHAEFAASHHQMRKKHKASDPLSNEAKTQGLRPIIKQGKNTRPQRSLILSTRRQSVVQKHRNQLAFIKNCRQAMQVPTITSRLWHLLLVTTLAYSSSCERRFKRRWSCSITQGRPKALVGCTLYTLQQEMNGWIYYDVKAEAI